MSNLGAEEDTCYRILDFWPEFKVGSGAQQLDIFFIEDTTKA